MSSQGVVQAVSAGSANIVATYQGQTKTIPTTVTEPVTQPPSGGSLANAHRPSGLTTRLDDNFNRALSAGSSDSQITSWATSGGWSSAASWVNGNIKTISDASGPNGSTGKRSLWTTAPAGSSPGGALSLTENLGTSKSQIYVYIAYKFESGYSHNTNSEKLIYFDNSSQNIIFEYLDGHQVFYHIDDPTNRYTKDSGGYLRANQEPNGRTSDYGNFPIAPPPPAGVWQQLEIFMDSNANTVQWWVDGRLYASYTNVTDFNPISQIMLDDTWGGSGSKSNATSGRVIDRFIIATN